MSIMRSLNGLPPEQQTQYTVLSLGAGVQSSALALMAAAGVVTPMPDFAIFADTGSEPKSVYDWLYYLTAKLPFPVHKVSQGDMWSDMIKMRKTKDGRHYCKGIIPAYTLNKDGTKGILGRSCTADYKIKPILIFLRKRCGIKRGQKEITITQWIGISYDEVMRMKPSQNKWTQHRWPLVELNMRRQDCIDWMRKNGFATPPRSACVYCPFHSDKEWLRLKTEEPEEFANAVELEKQLQQAKDLSDNFRSVPYLHNSCKPLGSIDFTNKTESDQMHLFINECEGLCGV